MSWVDPMDKMDMDEKKEKFGRHCMNVKRFQSKASRVSI